MAITRGAKKAVRSSERKRVFNVRRNNTMRDVVKDIKKAITAGETDKAKTLLPTVYKAIDKAAKRGVIKSNTANRKKSRLSAAIKRTVKA
jgi:small subunit ribosomal protein S20